MSKVRVFLSYDREHDEELVGRVLEMSAGAGSCFEIVSRSRARREDDLWDLELRREVQGSDEVIVLCGAHTGESVRVSAELQIAQEEKRPYMLLWGRRDAMCKKPLSAKSDDAMYGLSLEIIQDQILLMQRVAREGERAEQKRLEKEENAALAG